MVLLPPASFSVDLARNNPQIWSETGIMVVGMGQLLLPLLLLLPRLLSSASPPSEMCPKGRKRDTTWLFPSIMSGQRPGAIQLTQGGKGGADLMWAKATLGLG